MGPIVGWPGGHPANRPQARACATSCSRPVAGARCWSPGRPPGPSPGTCSRPRRCSARRRSRRTSRSPASRAPVTCSTPCSRPAAGCCSRWCCPTSTWTGRRTAARGRCTRPAAACWSRTARRSAPTPIAGADAVLVPGLAVSHDGLRLGRGAGCYDRALARVPVGTFTCVLLHDDEVGRGRARGAARPPRRRGRDALGRHPPGVSVSVSSAAARTAPRRERPRQRLPAGPEVGLVGVVPARRVARDAGQVDPARPVEVAQRHHHPHRRHVDHAVPVDGVPRRGVDGRAAAAELPAARG